MTEFEMFVCLIGFLAGIAIATIAFVTVWESRPRWISRNNPRVRTRYRYGSDLRTWR